MLESRLEIYTTVSSYVTQVPFNEMRLPANHTSRNDPYAFFRTIVTFRQAKILVNAVSLTDIANKGKLLIDISQITNWNYREDCYLNLHVFQSGSTNVQKRQFRTRVVQLKYLEASWPGDPVAHRIEPLHGSMTGHTKKRQRSDDNDQQQDPDEVHQKSQNYALMLQNLMHMLQQHLLLSDDNIQSRAQKSLDLVGGTATESEDNMICIWLEDVRDEH